MNDPLSPTREQGVGGCPCWRVGLWRRYVGTALLTLVALFVSCRGQAAPVQKKCGEPEPKKVKVTIVVILASEQGKEIDKRLKDIAAEVRREHPHLKSFKMKCWEVKSLAPNEKSSFKVVDKETAVVVVKHGADEQN